MQRRVRDHSRTSHRTAVEMRDSKQRSENRKETEFKPTPVRGHKVKAMDTKQKERDSFIQLQHEGC